MPLNQRGSATSGPLVRVLPQPVAEVLSALLGLLLTVMAIAGAVALWRMSRLMAVAVTGWLTATVGWLVLSPSGSPDRLLPLIAVACVLVGAAVAHGLSLHPESAPPMPVIRPGTDPDHRLKRS
jgi:hypothetical protein